MAAVSRKLVSSLLRQVQLTGCQHYVKPTLTQKLSTPVQKVLTRNMGAIPGADFVFRQLFDNRTYTYTYLLADRQTRDGIIIDPVVELVNRDLHIVMDLGINLKYALNTHVHADHVTGSGEIRTAVPGCKSVIASVSEAQADVKLQHNDVLKFGNFEIECRATPGHTNGCFTFVWHNKGMAFTGDALLIRGCGRTDFQQGDSSLLYDSVHQQILSLPAETILYPAHDYTGQSATTVGEEIEYNPRLSKPRSEFIQIMENLNLPYPKQIDRALPANMVCGIFDAPQASAE